MYGAFWCTGGNVSVFVLKYLKKCTNFSFALGTNDMLLHRPVIPQNFQERHKVTSSALWSNVGSSKNLGRAPFRKMPEAGLKIAQALETVFCQNFAEAPSLTRVWVEYLGFCRGSKPSRRMCDCDTVVFAYYQMSWKLLTVNWRFMLHVVENVKTVPPYANWSTFNVYCKIIFYPVLDLNWTFALTCNILYMLIFKRDFSFASSYQERCKIVVFKWDSYTLAIPCMPDILRKLLCNLG